MSDLISRSALLKKIAEEYDLNYGEILINPERFYEMVETVPTAYDISKVVEEVKKLDLDGVSMVEDGKYKLVRKNEVISLIQTNGVCNGRHSTCADCYKKDCTLSTEKTLTDKWSEEVRKGGVE